MMRQCGGCSLCCRLLPMQAEAYSREHVAETCAAMVTAGWATAESFMQDLQKIGPDRAPVKLRQ
jgi:hypothetical protein